MDRTWAQSIAQHLKNHLPGERKKMEITAVQCKHFWHSQLNFFVNERLTNSHRRLLKLRRYDTLKRPYLYTLFSENCVFLSNIFWELPLKIFGECLNSEYMWQWSPIYNFNSATTLKKLLSSGVEQSNLHFCFFVCIFPWFFLVGFNWHFFLQIPNRSCNCPDRRRPHW